MNSYADMLNMMDKDLKKIDEILLNCNDLNKKKLLLRDRELLLYYLRNKKIDEKYILHNIPLKEKDILDTILTNQKKYPGLRPFKRVKNINDLKIFDEFIHFDFFGLKNCYNKILEDNSIIFTKNLQSSIGECLFIHSLSKNYILIGDCKKELEGGVMIHELGHAKQNLLKQTLLSNYLDSNFAEAYSYFLMLVYYEFIKEFGLAKESFNFKLKFLNNLLIELNILYDLYDPKNRINKLFNKQYKYAVSKLLAIYFYNLYLENPYKCLETINIFNENYGDTSDYNLLNNIGINFDIFKNRKLINAFTLNLQEEKEKIKQK